ncbi:hypothetical protein ACFQ4N_09835 [Oceanobacillus iheyensis]|uniref:Hypothetical conserved protein n=1 Tax=Oceanobacillus iheyensis (strain DSM 14371 / CIP 107618 / JCM 11309 / KCTC 3954 / HTE831) TaxID=221109 RepID=Q8ERL0_OCEIH|nr:hypothetical protein [Oceanobacillus iheyensis]BAC13248.1 hypothetical conserved protein [Oceanobacillus iheyensis HTE831]
MKKYMWLLLVVLFIIGGCGMNNDPEENVSPSEMNAEDLPDVPALQDEFTRKFIQSTKPVREGFYPFLSKSKSFTMDFPEDMVISNRTHNIGPDDRSETITFADVDKTKEIFVNYSLRYFKGEPNVEYTMIRMTESHDRELEFRDIETDNNSNLSIAEYRPDEQFYIIAVFIWNTHGQINLTIRLRCNDKLEANQCSEKTNSEKEKLMKQIKSINIINSKKE